MTSPPSPSPTPKPVAASRVTLSQLMQPEHANSRGDVHGGWIMKLADEAGALAAMRHAQARVVTVAIDQMRFHEPIRIGDLVILEAEVTYVGRTSLETRIRVLAENPVTGERTHTNTAYIVYVALDESGRPRPVPPLLAQSDAEVRRQKAGKARQAYRLDQRERDREDDGE
ncbi:MAG TPA: acyl-CoA thioesterase [Anaerolineales bacterium]|nr:acyl-CoA thioesterase [Anaerolineales bacterium]